MISNKWLNLLGFLQQQTHTFAPDAQLTDLLNSKFTFLKNQFSNVNHGNDPRYIDWIEHETFTAVLSDVMREQSFTETELCCAFDLLISAKLFQLALSAVMNHQQVLEKDSFEIKRGIAMQQLGENQQAEQAFTAAIAINPDNHMALFHLGYIQICSGNMEKAIGYFKECTEKAPDFVGGYQNLAGCYYQDEAFEHAAECCEQAHRIDQTVISSYITAVSSYLALGQLEKAGDWLQRAREHQIENIELCRLGGIWAHQSGKHQQAISELTRYLEAKPEELDVLAIRAQALAADNQWQPLLADLNVLLELDPFDGWNLEQMFLASYHTQQWEQAERVMAELSKISAHYKVSHRRLIEDIRKQQAILMTAAG
ncbi:tetratricopeptide repeat protein [Photobacterium lipolyticum]|uniref:Uncharacterized protein n=1 Tax=Photobacterium lipolyticum TaxID=266810 RepID=A0A2T3MWF3_9GAMM|nr:tetratricopeptide repeat protein [Photobacterium lipolyticum]PSW04300.1 hypothetical protein C9I89_13290 [Photobacterium lipolyticum]